jgi:hypothetical protein
MRTDEIAPRVVERAATVSRQSVRPIMWAAGRMALYSFIAGMYLSGPRWEHQHNYFDYVFTAFWTALVIQMAVRLRRLVVESAPTSAPSGL